MISAWMFIDFHVETCILYETELPYPKKQCKTSTIVWHFFCERNTHTHTDSTTSEIIPEIIILKNIVLCLSCNFSACLREHVN